MNKINFWGAGPPPIPLMCLDISVYDIFGNPIYFLILVIGAAPLSRKIKILKFLKSKN